MAGWTGSRISGWSNACGKARHWTGMSTTAPLAPRSSWQASNRSPIAANRWICPTSPAAPGGRGPRRGSSTRTGGSSGPEASGLFCFRRGAHNSRRRRAMNKSTLLGFALSATLACAVHAQDNYPSKPVRIMVSFAAGGPTDQVARIVGAKLTDLLGQAFIVENKTGAGGNIGADVVAKAPPDGYTLLMATVSTHAINPGLYKKMPYDPVRDFAPIGQVGVTPTLLAVHPSVPATDVKSLVAVIKENPGKFTYGSSGLGSILHLCGEQFKALAGRVNAVHVPYRGSAPMMSGFV